VHFVSDKVSVASLPEETEGELMTSCQCQPNKSVHCIAANSVASHMPHYVKKMTSLQNGNT